VGFYRQNTGNITWLTLAMPACHRPFTFIWNDELVSVMQFSLSVFAVSVGHAPPLTQCSWRSPCGQLGETVKWNGCQLRVISVSGSQDCRLHERRRRCNRFQLDPQ